MPKTINFIFGLHCHQPVGNFDHVFREATEKSYKPFLEVAERHPSVKLTLHYTGILLEWLKANDPAVLAMIKKMVARGQVEMMTGGFYEPILAVIPDADKVGQIRKQTEWLKREFGANARGMWLAERVWEPHLPKVLREAGVEYLTVDDSHFKASGIMGEALTGRYVTEEQGATVEVFPILETLRYLTPFRAAHETIDYLRTLATEDGVRCAVVADDGEKYGSWPDTYDWVYRQGGLETFFTLLEQNADWIKACTFSEYRAKTRPFGRAYLPTASYTEMGEWAQPAPAVAALEEAMAWMKQAGKWDAYGTFLRGGYWRNFMAKYEESNGLHKKMLHTSRRVASLKAADAAVAAKAQDHLWQGQCNCPYWHGVFGGLYLNHLRTALYECIIAADNAMDALEGRGTDYVTVQQTDFDGDGNAECILENSAMAKASRWAVISSSVVNDAFPDGAPTFSG